MNSKKLNEFQRSCQVLKNFEDNFVLYMDNDAKHISVENLNLYNNYEIETSPSHSFDLSLIEKCVGSKITKRHEFKNVDDVTHEKYPFSSPQERGYFLRIHNS